ncbi:MAG: MMPL family transporter [Bacteroidales bacterium]|nr:MMPL family transporter [Bacteroidales bacterium]
MKSIAQFFIKYRYFLLLLMVASGVVSFTLFPKINVISDMTQFLPDDSRMKQGLDSLKGSFSGIDINGAGVSAMFANEAINDSLDAHLSGMDGVAAIMGKRTNENYTLYQMILEPGTSPDSVADVIRGEYGSSVTVETASANLLPDDMDFIIIAGVSLLTLILVIMCSSIVEVLLFILAIGLAVIINIGTNAFLPGVSMVTNAIAAILQLILSMDYSIILMNRFRQTRMKNIAKVDAMTSALADATPTILSSAMTTMLGMAMLAFMDFKIGLDMGLVLSKGVFLSLVSIYFVLPALVLAFDGLIQKTEKRVPLIHTYKLSKLEVRCRILIAVLFVLFFGASYHLSQRTKFCFSGAWPTEITREFPPQNQIVLLYGTNEEEKVIPLIDSLGKNPRIEMAMSYPSIMLKERTPAQLMDFIGEMSSLLPSGAALPAVDSTLPVADLLDILYYAASHPQRDEMMSFSDIENFVSQLPAEYMAGFDMEKMMEEVMKNITGEEEEVEEEPVAEEPEAVADTSSLFVPEATPLADTLALHADSVAIAEPADTVASVSATTRFTAENSTRALTSEEMADFLGFEKKQASAVYRIAGRAKSVMTPQEFVHYIMDNILKRNLYSMMIPDGQKKELAVVRHQIDSAVVAGSMMAAIPATLLADTPADTLKAEIFPSDSVLVAEAVPQEPAVMAPVPEEKKEIKVEPTPLDILLDMVASGEKYSAEKIGSTLRNAGVDIQQSDVELLFMCYGGLNSDTDTLKMSLSGIIDFVTGPMLSDPMYSRFIDDSAKVGITSIKQSVTEGLGNLRGEKFSIATIVSGYQSESQETFDFIEGLYDDCDRTFEGDYYLIGESVMYNEMNEGFKKEMLVVTLLTILVIFMVVAITFRSFIVPVFLLLIVLSAVYVCLFVGGLGGKSMNYLAYLVTQSILMGATIDYAILFTGYYREKRRKKLSIADSLRKAYKNSTHSIMTSGLILILCPYIMSLLLTDPTLSTILSSISVGALSAILLIVFVLPGLLAAFDKVVKG